VVEVDVDGIRQRRDLVVHRVDIQVQLGDAAAVDTGPVVIAARGVADAAGVVSRGDPVVVAAVRVDDLEGVDGLDVLSGESDPRVRRGGVVDWRLKRRGVTDSDTDLLFGIAKVAPAAFVARPRLQQRVAVTTVPVSINFTVAVDHAAVPRDVVLVVAAERCGRKQAFGVFADAVGDVPMPMRVLLDPLRLAGDGVNRDVLVLVGVAREARFPQGSPDVVKGTVPSGHVSWPSA
jgi:hypothetical protein